MSQVRGGNAKGSTSLADNGTLQSMSRRGRRHRSLQSEAAVEDGRRFLLAFQRRREQTLRRTLPPNRDVGTSPSPTVVQRPAANRHDILGQRQNLPLGALQYDSRCSETDAGSTGNDDVDVNVTSSPIKISAENPVGVSKVTASQEEDDTAVLSPRTCSVSPTDLTTEISRREARVSQAAMLADVLGPRDGRTELEKSFPPFSENLSTLVGDSEKIPPSRGRDRVAREDETAFIRWNHLQRLRKQSSELGKASKRHINRALELLRDIRAQESSRIDVGIDIMNGLEQRSRLDALQSTLRGLEEIEDKKLQLEGMAQADSDSLGGPASVMDLLESTRDTSKVDSSSKNDLLHADVTDTPINYETAKGGWITSTQLRAFEQHVSSRWSLEVASLASERQKLKGKVELFQRQVHFLQRDLADRKAVGMAPTRHVGGHRDGWSDGQENIRRDDGFIAGMLDSRLGEDSNLQARWEAEVVALRGTLEEKDGLIDALREALRSAAAQENHSGDEKSGMTNHDVNGTVDGTSRSQSTSTNIENRQGSGGEAANDGDVDCLPSTKIRDDVHRTNGTTTRYALQINSEDDDAEGFEIERVGLSGNHRTEEGPAAKRSVNEDGAGALRHSPLSLAEVGNDIVMGEEEIGETRGVVDFVSTEAVIDSHSPDRAEPPLVQVPPQTPDGVQNVPLEGSSARQYASGDTYGSGVVSTAAAVPGYAWRTARSAALAVGSGIGIGSSRGHRRVPHRQAESSHAVMIM